MRFTQKTIVVSICVICSQIFILKLRLWLKLIWPMHFLLRSSWWIFGLINKQFAAFLHCFSVNDILQYIVEYVVKIQILTIFRHLLVILSCRCGKNTSAGVRYILPTRNCHTEAICTRTKPKSSLLPLVRGIWVILTLCVCALLSKIIHLRIYKRHRPSDAHRMG